MTIRLVLLLSAITVTASAHVTPPIVLASDRDAITTLLPGARRHFVHEVRLTDEERQAIQMQSGWARGRLLPVLHRPRRAAS